MIYRQVVLLLLCSCAERLSLLIKKSLTKKNHTHLAVDDPSLLLSPEAIPQPFSEAHRKNVLNQKWNIFSCQPRGCNILNKIFGEVFCRKTELFKCRDTEVVLGGSATIFVYRFLSITKTAVKICVFHYVPYSLDLSPSGLKPPREVFRKNSAPSSNRAPQK